MNKETDWERVLSLVDYAFQPIVNIHTGCVFGVEALIRNVDKAGFSTIQDLFDRACEERVLYALDLRLRETALRKFLKTTFSDSSKLFYNLDNRVLDMPDYSPGNTTKLMESLGLPCSTLCIEISERYEFRNFGRPADVLDMYKQQRFRIAIDDFGCGYSGLQLLYHAEPDIVKLDRFFIAGIENDAKKKLFVTNIVNMAHIMGIAVIAEGVETEREFYVCREIGCDFLQGYLVQYPVLDLANLKQKYGIIEDLVSRDRRYRETSQDLIYRKMEAKEAIEVGKSIIEVLDLFRNDHNISFIPVVNENREPLGVLREKDLKNYVYSPYGISLLTNDAYGGSLYTFLSKTPMVEIHTRVEKILEIFALDKEAEAVIITENGKYKGLLDHRSLLQVLNEKEIAEARDQNPLSKLPGNNVINERISESLAGTGKETAFLYFDFDNFKPFNDVYGFRRGDRVILLFAELLREEGRRRDWFIGHVGGDDFFAEVSGGELDREAVRTGARMLLDRFTEDVKAFYGPEDRKRGYIVSKTRDGKTRRFPLLGVSVAIVIFSKETEGFSLDDLSRLIAELKKKAKESPERMASLYLEAGAVPLGR